MMHASIPITHVFLEFLYLSFLFYFFFSFLRSTSISCCGSSSFSVFITMAFYTACRDRNYHFYPLIAFGSLWVSFQDYPLACRLPNHYHCTVLVAPRLIPRKKWFDLSLTSLYFHYSHMDKS